MLEALLPYALLLLPLSASSVVPQPSSSLGGVGALAEEGVERALAGEDDECRSPGDQWCALQALQLARGRRAGHDRVLEQAIQVQELEESELGRYEAAQEILPSKAAVVSVAEAEAADKKCKMITIRLVYGAEVGVFGLPGNASLGTLVQHECKFVNMKYPYGEVTFECVSARWQYKSDTCALCPAASLPVETGSAQGFAHLPRALRAGVRAESQCKGLSGHEATYQYGSLSFTCEENGTWAYEKDSCAVCPSSDFTLTYGGDPGIFKLPLASVNGMEVEQPCNFQQQSFSFGSVKFQCEAGGAGGGWKYASDTCAACPAQNLTVKDGDNEGTFDLPRTGRIGGTAWKYCAFGKHRYNWGVVYFECGTAGWSLLNKTCAACEATKPFSITYGADVGVFKLPSAAKEGEIRDEPCVFGNTTYPSGVVRFACEGGRWNLQTATCVESEVEAIQSASS